MRKVCVITGTRAEYGILRHLMAQINNSGELELSILATGMHLLEEFGHTVDDITADGFRVDEEVPCVVQTNGRTDMALSIGTGVNGITKALDRLNPDIVIVLGDRFEMLAAAIAATYSGRVLAHISGGDNPHGGYDEYTRHAITKLAHIHLPSNKASADRIIKMGENQKHVFTVGLPSIDTIHTNPVPEPGEIKVKYGLSDDSRSAIVLLHSLSTSPDTAADEMRITLDSVIAEGLQAVVIYPNADPGGEQMISVIEEYSSNHDSVTGYKSLPYDDYLGLMSTVDIMLGNSSSGIIEAPSFGLPCINIGPRQMGREMSGNIIQVSYSGEEIRQAIRKATDDEEFISRAGSCENLYGDGHASEKIVKILSEIELDGELLRKKLML